jgi:predicted MPP superfamily phosphohydrolase
MKKLESFLLLLIFLCASCAKDQWFDPPLKGPGNNNSPYNLISPQIRIAVLSDIHFMDPAIAPDDPENNPEWQSMVTHDRKIFELSAPIFIKVVSDLIQEKPDILLITGDLAMEGQLVCHEAVQSRLQELRNAGIRVFVVPGNNDINNPDSKTYKTVPFTSISSITAEGFASLYADCGFNEAIYRDVNSLSYICQPFDNLWILGIDGVKRSASGSSGAINPLTLTWIQEKMAEANEKNITVLAMMHYGILEHYKGQKSLEPLISGQKNMAIALMNAGIRLIFTGHYHANDISDFSNEGKILSDIQTGSLVTPPYSYRMMTLDDNFINIDTRRVTYSGTGIPEDKFIEYSGSVFTSRINGFFNYYGPYLQSAFGIPPDLYPLAIPRFTEAFKSYFAGDEKLWPEEQVQIEILEQTVPSALPLLNSWWSDLLPGDNKIHIQLK